MTAPEGTGDRLIIELPEQRFVERSYVLSVLFDDWLALPHEVVARPGAGVTTIKRPGDPAVLAIPDVLFADADDWLSPGSLHASPLPTVSEPEPMPLLFAVDGDAPIFADVQGRTGSLGFDLIGALFLLLARYDEHVRSDVRDEHGRVPAQASVLHASGWSRWPIADMYLHAFANVLDQLWPGLARLGTDAGLHLSHDVDHPTSRHRYHGSQRLRLLGADVVRRRDPRLATDRALAFTPFERARRRDPFDTFDLLMDTSEAAGTSSVFYFLSSHTDMPRGSRFSLDEPWAGRLMRDITARGHGIGLHGSYLSSTDAEQLELEWAALATACEAHHVADPSRAVRQHYLMMEPGTTWRSQAAAGFELDETLGFPEEIGYRAGTARSFEAFDIIERRRLGMRVQPLHVMDVALARVSSDTEERFELVTELGHRTRRYGGSLSLLWHNSSLETTASRREYRSLVEALAT